jgi:phosphoglycolate phosphatase-like HAD superfamily hydrolase
MTVQRKGKSMLIFDFDGVLMDSINEVAVTTYNMLQDNLATRLNQLPQGALNLFLRNRFHVQPIGDALLLMKWCLETGESEPQKLLSEKEYEDIIRHADELVAERTNRFFETRKRFKSRDIKSWTELNKPIQPLWNRLIEHQTGEPVILTNKNREATVDLCNHYGLKISNDNIYSGDNGTTKIDNMQQIMQRFEAGGYTFVDDSVKNLREIDAYFNKDKKTVALILAEWGYTGPDDARLAGSLGYQSLTMHEFMDRLPRFFAGQEIKSQEPACSRQ